MVVLAIKTDQPKACIALHRIEPKQDCLDEITWQAHRELSATLLSKVEELLKRNNFVWSDISGVIVYKGPGSFTGLRIGVSVANAIAYSLNVSVVATSSISWQKKGLTMLKQGKGTKIVEPEYGAPAYTTKPRK